MRIEGNRGVSRTGTIAGKSSQGVGAFSSMVSVPEAPSVPTGLPVSPLASILGISEESPEQQRRRKAVRHAKSLLEDLDELHRALCLGSLNEAQLKALAQKLEAEPLPADAELADLVGQIEVRIAVELARLERYQV